MINEWSRIGILQQKYDLFNMNDQAVHAVTSERHHLYWYKDDHALAKIHMH